MFEPSNLESGEARCRRVCELSFKLEPRMNLVAASRVWTDEVTHSACECRSRFEAHVLVASAVRTG